MEKYDILTLDNGKDYTICQMTDYNSKNYVLLVEVDEDENVLDDKIIAEYNEYNNEIKIVNDENLYKIISSVFKDMILQDLDNNN